MTTADESLGRVVLVEDNEADARLVQMRLRQSFQVDHVTTLAGAHALLEDASVEAVLLDLGLPDTVHTSGVQALRTAFPDVPIVVLTGLDDDAIGAQAVRDGAQDYLVKDEVTATSLPRSIRYAIQRKQTEALRAQLQHADRLASIGQLSAAVAHEINNPSAFVMTNTHMCSELTDELIELLKALPAQMAAGFGDKCGQELQRVISEFALPKLDEQREMLADSEEGVRRIRSIVRDLGSFSRIEHDVFEWVDINDIVHLACNFTRNEVRHRAALQVDLEHCPTIVAHRARLSQVLVNIILNAAQAIDEGDPRHNVVRVTTRLKREDEEICITIEDTGSGIPADMQQRLFEPFFTTKAREQGTGLGLALCRDAVLAHSGRISVESQVGRGTTFTIALPLVTGLRPRAPSRPTPAPVESDQRAHILLIDDEPAIQRSYRRLLKGHHDVEVGDATDGLGRLDRGEEFDLILCDLMMPEVDGPAFYEALAQRHPQYLERTVFVSGGAVTPRVREFVARTDVLVLDKPVPRDQLLQVIQQRLHMGEIKHASSA